MAERDLSSEIHTLLRTNSAMGSLRFVVNLVTLAVDELELAVEQEPELGPEIATLVESLSEAVETASRGVDFLVARLLVKFNVDEGEGT